MHEDRPVEEESPTPPVEESADDKAEEYEEGSVEKAVRDVFPIFVDKPLSEPVDGTAKPEILNVAGDWKRIEDGWTVIRACPDTGAQVSVGTSEMASGYPAECCQQGRPRLQVGLEAFDTLHW